MKAESEIEKMLVRGVKQQGGIAYKFVSPGNSGVPDRIVLSKYGEVVFVELKTEKGKLSPLQKIQIGKIREHGQEATVVYGERGVNKFLDLFRNIDCIKMPTELR